MKLTKKLLAIMLSMIMIVPFFSIASVFAEESQEEDLQVLLIEDNLPWSSEANSTVLNKIGVSYTKITTTQFNDVNLWNYDMVVVANDQNHDTYQNFKDFKEQLDLFANLGGVIIYGASDAGWATGTIQTDLPGGVKKELYYSHYNYVVDSDHPIVTASLSDGNGISDYDLYEDYCSHNDFLIESLPDDCNIILKSENGNPTLIEYPMGSGYIIASSLTWEFNYVRANYRYYASKVMDDLFLYGLSLCNKVNNTTAEKMKIKRDNNNFTHSSTSFFYNNEKQKYLMTDKDFNKLNSYYEQSFIEWLPFTKNQLQKARDSKWGGSCFGLSVSMALAYMNKIDLNNFVTFSNNEDDVYYNAPMPKQNVNFRSMINYYQLSQYVPMIDKKSVSASANDTSAYKKELQTIVELAKQSEKSGIPFIFTFGYKWTKDGNNDSAGHAIVCIGAEEVGNNYRIQFIDPNNTMDYIYATIDKNYSGITFESKYTASAQKTNNGRNNWKITWIGHDTLTTFYAIDIDGDSPNNKAKMAKAVNVEDIDIILFDSNAQFEITNSNGETLIFDGAEISGTMNILDIQHYEKGETIDYQVAVESSDSYEIDSARENIDISIYDSEDYYSVVGKNITDIDITMSENATIEGNQMDCEFYYGGIDGENTDMIKFENDNTDKIVVEETSDALVVGGDNIENTRTLGFSDAQTYEVSAEGSDGENLYYGKDNEIIPSIYIGTPSTNSIKYGETLMLYAYPENIPNGSKVVWSTTGKAVELKVSEDGNACAVVAKSNGTVDVTVMVVDENGEIVIIDDMKLESSQTIKVKSNIFIKIIAFFKKIFKVDMIIDD